MNARPIEIDDTVVDFIFAIGGLAFEHNDVIDLKHPPGWFSKKLLSSPGPLISDFVTHEEHFAYGSFGIHVSQDDRLTFMYAEPSMDKWILGSFVDCRVNSPTLKLRIDILFRPSIYRRLIIPRGVAHTFDGLEKVVTRDEPVWHSSPSNADWNVDNDLISVDRSLPLSKFPEVQPNLYRMSDALHCFQSRLSQELLRTPKSYLARYPITIAGERRFVTFKAKEWGDNEDNEVSALLAVELPSGVKFFRSRYALTGPRSWTVVPNTDACVADVMLLPCAATAPRKVVHHRTRMWYTALSSEGATLEISSLDCRRDSPEFHKEVTVRTVCDPRVSIMIEHGVAYSIRCSKTVILRAEQEIFAATNEPRGDLPIFGADSSFIEADMMPPSIDVPTLSCSQAVVRMLAAAEITAVRPRDFHINSQVGGKYD